MTNLSSYCGLVDAKKRASDKDLPVQAANLGGSGSSPGILALVAFVSFVFGCATVLVVQKVRKRKGNAGKKLKGLPNFLK